MWSDRARPRRLHVPYATFASDRLQFMKPTTTNITLYRIDCGAFCSSDHSHRTTFPDCRQPSPNRPAQSLPRSTPAAFIEHCQCSSTATILSVFSCCSGPTTLWMALLSVLFFLHTYSLLLLLIFLFCRNRHRRPSFSLCQILCGTLSLTQAMLVTVAATIAEAAGRGTWNTA